MKLVILAILALLSTESFGQYPDRFEPYRQADYPQGKYETTYDSTRFSSFLIEVRQIRSKFSSDPFTCRAWLTVTAKNKIIYQRYFKDIEAVGDCHGIFIPFSQPRVDFFILSKLGDYDGRIFIIDTTGNVTEKIGGEFYISTDKQYLFSNYHSDLSGLTVFDFCEGKTIFSDTIEPKILDWYYKDKKFYTSFESLDGRDSNNYYYNFDFNSRRLIITSHEKEYLKAEDKLNSYNGLTTRRFCNCGLEKTQRQK